MSAFETEYDPRIAGKEWRRKLRALHSKGGRSLAFPGNVGDFVDTVDSAAFNFTDDIQIIVDAAANVWNSGVVQNLVLKYVATGNQRSFAFRLLSSGLLSFLSSVDGINDRVDNCDVSMQSQFAHGQRVAMKVTGDLDDGGGNRVIRFWTSIDGRATWRQLGSTLTVAGTGAIFDSTADVSIGSTSSGGAQLFAGRIFFVELQHAGVVVAKLDPNEAVGSPFISSSGESWTLRGGVQFQ